MREGARERGKKRGRECAIYKFSDKPADNNKHNNRKERQQQSPKGKQFNRGAEAEWEWERGREREGVRGSQLDNFILQGSQKMWHKGGVAEEQQKQQRHRQLSRGL